MSMLSIISQKILGKRALFLQLLLVTLAFLLMVFSSTLFVRNMLRNNLRRDAVDLLTQTKYKMEAKLIEPETAIITISNMIRTMILEGAGADKILKYLQDISDGLQSKTRGFQFCGVYGYFEIFDGVYLSAPGWDIQKDYDPAGLLWYKTAVDAGDKVAVTPIYMSLLVNDYIITYVHRIFDEDGQPLGMVCLNVPLVYIINYVGDMRLTDGSYGIFLGEEMNIYYHPNRELIGENINDVGGGISMQTDELLSGGGFFEHESTNYAQELMVTFSIRLENGWVLYSVTPKAEYYRDLTYMNLILGILGVIFSGALIVILIRVDRAKDKADEQSHKKSLLLVERQKVENDLRLARDIAEENSKAKSKFLATVSHEIRTPMNVILGLTESQLMTETLSPEDKKVFEKIFDSGNLLLHIINDLLDLSKTEAGKFELNPAKYEVLSLINDASNMNLIKFAHKPIKFLLRVDENIPLCLFGDELRIKQILNNLLSNAFKYTNTGEVELAFGVDNSDENKTTLIIRVRDTGQGMTPEQVNNLFIEYSRFNLEVNRTTLGTGLGMAITNNLVKMMNGQISVDSTPGKGTTFTVRIPQEIRGSGLLGKKIAEDFQKFNFSNIERERHINITRESMPYGRVLVVDDMESNLDVAKLLLAPYELQVDTAESGFEVIDIIKNGKVYDIIFLDHMMPEMDGIETTKKLREAGYKNPIFALTANVVAGQREMFLANGFDGYLPKPIDLRQLNDSLNQFVRDKKRDMPKEQALQQDPVIQIPGVDTETGIARYGRDSKMYIAVLRSYVSNALKVIDKLREVSKETLPDYAIKVHGLKGLSAGIGAEKVGELAYNLEMMAKYGDLAGVLAGNEAFFKELEKLVSDVRTWLKETDSRDSRLLLPYPEKNLLVRLRECCEAHDVKGIDEAMDKLESANYETDAMLVLWLRKKINESEFSLVVERLLKYEQEK